MLDEIKNGSDTPHSIFAFFEFQAPIEFESVDVTPVVGLDGKTQIPAEAIESVNNNKIGLKGWLLLLFNMHKK